jgi:photosystem II stability/assembly factor-like uncharacterized protein
MTNITLFAQWANLNTGTSGNCFYSMYFIDADTGYAVGGFYSGTYHSTILKTTNGGTNWIQQTSGINNLLYSVYFTDANTGYTVGGSGTILKTTNGGSNWTAQTSGIVDLYSVYFPISNTGYAVGGYYNNSTILKTTDGGTNWAQQTSGVTNCLKSVYFTDVNMGYTVGDSGKILKTTNGGANWTIQNSGTNWDLSSTFFINNSTGFAVGGKYLWNPPNPYEFRLIAKTTDGGINWSSQTTTALSRFLYSVYFTDLNTGYAVGNVGTVIKTTDGGTNWIGQNSGTTAILYSVFFTGINYGYAAGSNFSGSYGGGCDTIIKTTNGGLQWIEEKNKKEFLKIYPNPVSEQLTIETTKLTKESTLTIVNVSGQELIRQNMKDSKTQLDISNLTKGIYFVKLITDKKVEVRKIIKE